MTTFFIMTREPIKASLENGLKILKTTVTYLSYSGTNLESHLYFAPHFHNGKNSDLNCYARYTR
jgi:hypothetical protein